MNNTVKRVILFIVAIPAIAAIVLYLPQYGHLSVIVILTAVGTLCGFELRSLLMKAAPPLPLWSAAMPGLVPVLSWTVNMGWLPSAAPTAAMILAVAWALFDAAFAKETDLGAGFARMASRLLMVMYPGWLIWWTARLTWFDRSGPILLVFALAVFINDSAAWLFGVLFGRHRGLFAVSPMKSLEGFLGGALGSVVVIVGSSYLFPDALPHPLWQLICFGLVFAAATSLGDLTESVLKRAVGAKDSGKIILGRGGMLDSVDSLLFTAPFFVLFIQSAAL